MQKICHHGPMTSKRRTKKHARPRKRSKRPTTLSKPAKATTAPPGPKKAHKGANKRKSATNASKTPKLGSKAFIKLLNQWYAKLSKSGFEDIEWYDPKTGKGQNSDMLHRPAGNIGRTYSKSTEFYYAMCRNYITHVKQVAPPGLNMSTKLYTKVVKLYTEGLSYRAINKALKKQGITLSVFAIFTALGEFKHHMIAWNEQDKEGLLNPNQTDAYLEEVLLRDDKLVGQGAD